MKQTRLTSLFKSLVSTGVGFGVAFVANMLILPLFGLPISHSANLLLTSIYTVISIARGYALERVFEALGWRQRISPFMAAVIAERQRQQDVEGWSLSHDDAHQPGELACAGATYAAGAKAHLDDHPIKDWGYSRLLWPWSNEWLKPTGFRRDLVKAGALIIAEGEKFDRARKPRRLGVVPDNPWPRMTDDRSSTHAPSIDSNTSTLAHGKTRSQHAGSSE